MDRINPSLIPDLSFTKEKTRLMQYKSERINDLGLFNFPYLLNIRIGQFKQNDECFLFFFTKLTLT
jgi:hypothetical protein